MALQRIWIGLFVIALLFVGWNEVAFWLDIDSQEVNASTPSSIAVNKLYGSAKGAANLLVNLVGMWAFFLGLLKVAEKSGFVDRLASWIAPSLNILFPDLKDNDKAFGPITMNVAANLMGLGNAATPFGLKAMEEMQEANQDKAVASNAQIMFLVINTSGITLLPLSVMAVRASYDVPNPALVFLPILIATTVSTLVGIGLVSVKQRINLWKPAFFKLVGLLSVFGAIIVTLYALLDKTVFSYFSMSLSNLVILLVVVGFLVNAALKKTPVFNDFIEGAKECLPLGQRIMPYLVAMLVAVGVFKASGALDYLTSGLSYLSQSDFWQGVSHALPVALMRPVSGGAAEALMISNIESIATFPEDLQSFIVNLSCTFQGTTETTFYVIALYFGAVGIKKIRYAAWYGLAADFSGMIAAIIVSYFFYF